MPDEIIAYVLGYVRAASAHAETPRVATDEIIGEALIAALDVYNRAARDALNAIVNDSFIASGKAVIIEEDAWVPPPVEWRPAESHPVGAR